MGKQLEPFRGDFNSQYFARWIEAMYKKITDVTAIFWSQIDKTDSTLSDIATRPHSVLQDILGWVTGTNTEQTKHISSADGKIWQDHVEIIDGNPHGTDWDMIEGTATYIPFNTSPTGVPANSPGVLSWDAADGTIDVQLYNQTTMQLGQEMFFYGKASGNILNGELCEFAGVEGNHIKVKKAVASEIIAAPHYVVGVATQNITNGNFGYITWFGKVNNVYTKAVNTGDSADWVAGDLLYFDNTTGQLTKVVPDSPKIRIIVAAVIKAATGAAENGILLVRPSFGIRFTDCDDVDGLPTLHGDFYTWNNTLNYFEPSRKIGDGTNYIEFEADGTDVRRGTATQWDDVYPSSVTVGIGGTAPNFTVYNGASLKAYEFTGGVSNKELHVGYQFYHSYKEESIIVPHLHLVFSSGAADIGKTIIFDMVYAWDNVDDTGAFAETTVQGTITIAANNTNYKNNILSFGNIAGTGKTISSTFMTLIRRRQDLDTFTGSCWLKSADIHIEKDMIGSRLALTK